MIRHIITFFILFINFSNAAISNIDEFSKDSTFFYSEKSNFFRNIKKYDQAIKNGENLIKYGKRIQNSPAIANGYYSIGMVNIETKKFDIAIKNLLQTASLLKSEPIDSKLALANYYLGVCYMNKSEFKTAEKYFGDSNTIYKQINLPGAINMLNLQKGILYAEKDKISEALRILEPLANLKDKANGFQYQSEAMYQLALLKLKDGTTNLSLNYLNRAYDLSLVNQNPSQKIKISKKISEVYEILKENNNSLAYLKIHLKLKDSISNISKLKEKNLNSDKLKVDDYVQKVEKMVNEKKQQDKNVRFSKLINILSIAFITILSLLSLSLYKNNVIRIKTNVLLSKKNSELEIAKEKIEKASKARAEFMSTVSHELRTPLNAINGISHILLEDNPKANQIEYLKSLKFSGNYLLTYINEILETNRIESDNIEVEHISFNVIELLKNIHNSLKEVASKNNNNFILNIDAEIPEIIVGDPTKLSQIFINLANNALKFTKNGKVIVNTKLIEKEGNNCKLKFEFQDDGIGIAKEKQESIFESFSQGSVEINRKYGGTGLGLSIVKRLVTLMHGDISVVSELGKGANFIVNFSFEIGKLIVENNENLIINEKIFVNKSILLVEDNKINQMVTRKFLQNKKMLCEICETGEDAILKLQNNTYDLVLMDVHLPGINGTLATEQIRKFDSKTPIIALTAISLNENREMLLSFGMNDVITKPFNPDTFYKIIETNLLIDSKTDKVI